MDEGRRWEGRGGECVEKDFQGIKKRGGGALEINSDLGSPQRWKRWPGWRSLKAVSKPWGILAGPPATEKGKAAAAGTDISKAGV